MLYLNRLTLIQLDDRAGEGMIYDPLTGECYSPAKEMEMNHLPMNLAHWQTGLTLDEFVAGMKTHQARC